ncbi:hypothetical protein QUB37_18710 [Microcoleus sp. AT3-A2]|uniref:hypothetical protein n=1 Tax=Microcoleus sp. AT3-A2 TaxID=2818610 RepID=UPI002FD68D1D
MLQRRIVRRLVSEHEIDIVEPTPVSATVPSLMFGLGVSVVIGPMNTSVKCIGSISSQTKLITQTANMI